MGPLKNPSSTLANSLQITSRTAIKALLLAVVIVVVPLALAQRVKSTSQPIEPVASVSAVMVNAAGRGKPYLNLHDGRGMNVSYLGDPHAAAALQNGAAQPRALASADFDHNGAPDVVAGYAANGAGIIALQRGNPDAFAPMDDSMFVRMQRGYNPPSLLPAADAYAVPVSADFVATGNFNEDGHKDVLFAAKGGGLYLMAGDGEGRLGVAQEIALPGPVTALAAGEFRAADGFTDIAVGVSGPGGESLLIFDAVEGWSSALVQYQLSEAASGIEFGGLDDDPFTDVAVAAGNEILVVHGWGRKEPASPSLRQQRINVGPGLRGLALGHFTWDRHGRTEIAALSEDGSVRIVQNSKLDVREFSQAEAAERTRGKLTLQGTRLQDVESVPGWRAGKSDNWVIDRTFMTSSLTGRSASAKPLLKTNLSFREMDELMVVGGGNQRKLEIVRSVGPKDKALAEATIASESSTTLDVEGTPVAVLALPKKLNGAQDVVVLDSVMAEPIIVDNLANTTITVDRTDDPAGAALTAASACTDGGVNDCSLRGALEYANNPANNNTTINVPAGIYILNINGSTANGCSNSNATGDLAANQTMSILGAGSASTVIRQTGTGPANDGDRVMCMNELFTLNLTYNFSGITFTGGRDGAIGGVASVLGGGGIIGGEKGNILTLTDVTISNNQVIGPNLGGGGIQITGGDLNITNCSIGGANAPGTYGDRSTVGNANSNTTSGGGLMFTPSAPVHTASTGVLTVTSTTFSRNTASSGSAGGGGADLLIYAFAAPGGIGTGSANIGGNTVFSNNQALGTANGGGIIVETLGTTVSQTSFNNNSAANRGGGIYVAGASLLLNGTSPSITFSGNTATNGGSSVSTASATNVAGTNTTIGGDIEVTTGGTWTNNAGSSLAPTNVVIVGGTFNMNNSTMNVSGNLTIGPGPVVGSTFNGNTGTVNIQGNFVLNAGGAPATTLNAGTGTFNFNGTGAQSITNGTSITFFNLTDSNVTQPLTLNNSLAVNGSLNINGANAILSPVAAAVISGTGTLTGTGTARASRIAGTPDFLSQYTITNKTLTNLTIDYNGAGNQTVNNTPAYSHLRISGSGTKTLQGNTQINGNLNIAAATFSGSTFNFSLRGNWTNAATFTPGTGTVTFNGTTGTQLLTGNTTFFNLTLNNSGAFTNFGNTTTTIGNDLVTTAGTMDGGTSTIMFTGVTDNAGAISGAAAKNFHNLQINSPAAISHSTGADITIEGNYTNTGTFSQAAGLTTVFDLDNVSDGAHSLAGAGTTTFGVFTINTANTVNAGSHSFNVVGATFNVNGTGVFNGNTGTVLFNAGAGQAIVGDGAKNFSGLMINNPGFSVNVVNGASAVDASVSGVLTLTSDLSVSSTGPAILQQTGTSAGAADVVGIVRRTDLAGGLERSFGNVNNSIQINSGTAPTQMDLHLVKATPTGLPPTVKVVPRTYTLSPTGGAGILATVKLRYTDSDLVGPPVIPETNLILWKDLTGSDAWTPQGGTVSAVNNFVSLSGVSSFSEWAIAEGSDLTITKANNTSNDAVTGEAWNWTLTATNAGAPATFTTGQTILTDNLPNSNLNYGTPTVQNASNITGSANISCSIVSNDLTCTANGGSVTFDSNLGASSFQVVFSATPQAAGVYQNPRAAGNTQIDPNNNIVESNETNNTAANNTVTVTAAATTTTINSDNPDPSVVGEAVTVTWTVAVTPPGAVGTALTGNVTVSDGTNSCFAAVSAGQCNVTFTSAGAKTLTATYAGDSNYSGSASTPATSHTVGAANTTTTITEDNPDPSTPGQAVLVKYTVTVASPGGGTPTGTVTVSDGVDSNNTCTVADGVSGCSLTLNTNGNRTITATYLGNSDFSTSNDTEGHQVCGSSLVTTTADSGAGSLRQVIADACDGGTITFDSAGVFATAQTITLTTGEIAIDKNLTINAGSSQITISGNVAGRVFNINSGKTAAIVGLTITGGNSAQNGGAILNEGTLTVVNSTLTGNLTAIDGGAISNSATATSLTLINTTVSGNDANGFGGGVDVLGGTVTIINSTITGNRGDFDDNSAGGAGGIRRQAGTVTLHNTIVAGNFKGAATPTANDIEGTVTGSNNLIGDATTSGGLTHGTNGNIVGNAGVGTIDITTVLNTTLANNGGLTMTHALVASGAAVEAGSNANLPVDTFDLDGDTNVAESLPVDQRGLGFLRTADSADANATQTVDIGAFELHPSIENIGNKTTTENTAVSQFSFNLGDATGSGSPLIQSITASSSDTTVIPNANVVISAGASDTVRNVDITPASNQTGTSTITITVTATNGQTAVDTFEVTVTPPNDPVVNDPPVNSVPGAQVVNEDAVLTFNAANLNVISISDPDATTAQVTLTATNGTMSLSGIVGLTFTPPADGVADTTMTFTGSIADINAALNGMTYTPTPNFNGAATLTILTNDQGNTGTGGAKSDTDVINITVNNLNDPPTFTKGADQTDDEDAGPQTVNGWATSITSGPGDPSQTLTFTVTPTGSTGNLSFASAPAINSSTGTLTYTANADTNGSATFDVTLSDGTDTSAAQSFTITVNAVNDAPTFQLAGNPAAVNEDAGAQTVNSFATNFLPGPVTATDESSQTLVGYTVSQTGSTGSLTFSSGPAISNAGALTYTPTADTFGTATFNAVATDSGSGTAPNVNQSAAVAFTITVNAVNDPPSFTLAGNPPTVAVDAGAQTVNSFASNISQGPNETGQTLTFNLTAAGTTGTLAFSSGPDIDETTGNLTYTATAGTSGTATFDVTLSDDGGGTDTSAVQQFTITVVPQLSLIVNVTGDASDLAIDSVCDTDAAPGSQCTLRAAIQETNAVGSADTIGFSLPADSTIELTSALPAIAGDLEINGPTNGLTIDGNSTGRVFSVSSGTVSINTLAVTGGLVNGGHGAGLLVTGGDVTVKDMLFTANTAVNGNGGAIAVTGGLLTILNTTISGNTATNGGGVYNGGGLTMINVTVTNNTANGDIGGGPTAAGDGGGLHIGSNPTLLRNSIVAGNTATTNPNVSGTLGLGGNNLLSGNPLLAPLADNGGPTMTHALLAGSPALDAGNNTEATNAGLTNDQRGFDRITDGNGDAVDTVDIGAFEAQVWLEDIADRAIDEDGSDSFSFDVGGAAAITNVTATSSNTALVPNLPAALAISGSGGTRTLTITPAPNAFGTTTITVTVESASGSMSDTFLFTVNPVNDPPVFTGGPNVVVGEDAGPQTIPNWATGISPGPANESTQTLTFLVSNNNNSLFSVQPAIASNGTLTFTPAANATGVATVSVQLQDNGGGTDSYPIPPYQFTITVNAVNDPPTFTGGPNQTVNEDAGPQTVINWATGISAGPADESGQTLTFLVSNGNNSLFSAQPAIAANGTLTYTPAANASGVATVSVQLQDNGGGTDTSPFPPYTFTITVNAVNDAPSFTKGPNQTVNEDAGAQSVSNWATAISAGPPDESGQTVAFNVTNDNNALFSVQPAVSPTGTLTYTPAPDANGTATVSVSLTDNGGTANGGQNTSAVQTFTITVNAVNDGPVNTVPGAQSVSENSTLTFSAGNGNSISIADVDAGASGVQVTLTATNGTVTLSGTGGLSFTVGDGTADATMTFSGTVASINTALNGLVFTPTSGFDGAASLQIVTNDLGNTGSGGALSDSDTINITVNDGGTLQFSSATYSVNENGGTATITVNRTGGTAGTTTVDFATSNGTADGTDYTTSTGTLTFNNGVTSQSFTVPILNDPANEPNETVNLTLSNVTGSGQLGTPSTAILTITDNDTGFGLSASSYTVGEGDVNLAITVNRLGDATQPASVEYSTTDLSAGLRCEQFTGVASERCDYSARIGVLAFAAGQSSATINIPIIDDVHVEGPETFNITLSNPIGAVLGTPLTAVITITDNDTVFTQANPIDTFPFYVRMQYLDFLEREPDAVGFAYWLDRLNTCAANPACSLVQERIQVSAGFFYSNEFLLRKGYFIYRFYRASLGRAPTYHEFVKDMAAIGAVDADEDARRASFTLNWVTRPDFMAIYNGLSDADFVDQLVDTADVNLDRPALVAELQGGKSRAQLVRDVAENVLVYDKYFREAFVTTQYFGYLKRDPDAIGFAYWMDRVNLHPNDFRLEQHPEVVYEVVGGFIYSEEYQLRFGNRNY